MKIFFILVCLSASLFANEQMLTSHAIGCAQGASFMGLGKDYTKVKEQCTGCLNSVPMQIEKTTDNMKLMTEKCVEEYKKIINK